MLKIALFLFIYFIVPAPAFAFWPVFHADPRHSGLTEEAGPINPKILWKKSGFFMWTSPVVGKDGTIYAAGGDALYAVTKDGKEKWKYKEQAKGAEFSTPALSMDGKAVYALLVAAEEAGKPETYVLSINPGTGKVNWKRQASAYNTEQWLSHIVVSSAGLVYLAAGGRVAAYNPAGERLWSYAFATAAYPEPVTGPTLSPDEKTIYILKRLGAGLYALDAATGKMRWKDASSYRTDYSSPTVGHDGTIYIADNKSQAVYAVDEQGKRKWAAPFSGKCLIDTNPAIGKDGTVYVDIANTCGHDGGAIYAIDPKNGNIKWRFDIKTGYVGTPMSVDGKGNIYFSGDGGYIHCISINGALVWSFLLGEKVTDVTDTNMGQFFMSNPAISGKTLYIISNKGVLYALGSR